MLCFGQLHRVGYFEPGWAPDPRQIQHQILGFREAETLTNHHKIQVSSETISGDGYTGAHPGHTWIGANEETGGGEV